MTRRGVLGFALILGAIAALTHGVVEAQTRRTAAPEQTYFPLHVGNEWVYVRSNAIERSEWRAAVTERVTMRNGQTYFALAGYFGPRRLVRSGLREAVLEFNPDGNYDNLWYLLGAAVGTSWQLELEPLPTLGPAADCISGSKAVIASRTEAIKVPAGEFRDVVRIDYRSPCADAGLSSEWFAPGVGLIRREESSFAGPVVSELLRAELGDNQLPRLPYSVSLALDSPAYSHTVSSTIGPESIAAVRGAFLVRNRTDVPVSFTFGSFCKSVRIEVVNDAGEVVLRALGSDGGCCACDALLEFTLVNDTLALPVAFRLATAEGRPLPDGRYSVVATLNTTGGRAPQPAATTVIMIRSATTR
ncbi:MAG: hypothetical protein ACRDHY_10195, partial [Anaerolineales bacterium]